MSDRDTATEQRNRFSLSDDDVAELLAMDPDADYPALLVAVGTPK